MNDKTQIHSRPSFGEGIEGGCTAVKTFYEKTKRPGAFTWEKQYSEKLFDPTTGQLRPELIEPKICEVCMKDDSVHIFTKDGFPHVRCPHCESIYVNPALKQNVALELFYGEGLDPWLDVLMSEEQRKFDQIKFEKGLELVHRRSQPPGTLLDIGCSYGFFLKLARDASWDVMGIEPHQGARNIAEQAGFRVLATPLEQSNLPKESIRVVTLWEILDHVARPRQFLAAVAEVLEPGGALLVAVRNSNALAARILHEKCVIFLGRAHYTLFSVRGLQKFLEEFGFEVYFHETYIAELGVINNHLQYHDPYGHDRAPSSLDLLTPEYILEHDLGYKIIMLAQKRT